MVLAGWREQSNKMIDMMIKESIYNLEIDDTLAYI